MYFINSNIYDEIVSTIGEASIESGGIIGAVGDVICAFHFDDGNCSGEAVYAPNIESLNRVIQEWDQSNIAFIGIVHSHPNLCNIPSLSDGDYADMILKTNPQINKVIFPIVTRDESEVFITFYEYTDDFHLINVQIKY